MRISAECLLLDFGIEIIRGFAEIYKWTCFIPRNKVKICDLIVFHKSAYSK